MTRQHSFPAPAKLNLFLHVVGRRTDGYHLLQTAFTFIDYCDRLRIEVREDGAIVRAPSAQPSENSLAARYFTEVGEDQDLSIRAAKLLRSVTGCKLGATIAIEKRIPLGAGLGGGSSDAATTLIALNRLWELNLPRVRLQQLGLQLGADVPVFVFGQSAFAEGIGEQLQALAVPPAWYVVLTPPVQVSTREVFAAADLTRNADPIKIQSFPNAAWRNDLEPVVCRRYVQVSECLEWLRRFAPARMTGSGSAVFAALDTRARAEQVYSQRPAFVDGFVASGLGFHPLKDY